MPHPNDEEYARAIEYGYSPTAGGGMGVDRLVMILTERDTLREVIPFPIVQGALTMSASKLDLDPGVVAACRQAAERRSPTQVAEQIAGSTTVSVERSVTRLLGVDGADELEAPLPNVLVDHVHDRGGLGRGIAYWLGNAMLQTRRARRSRSPRRSAPASSTCCDARAAPRRARSASASREECAARLREISAPLRASAGRCASASATRRRRCATCSRRPATCTRTSCTPRPSRRPAATSSR